MACRTVRKASWTWDISDHVKDFCCDVQDDEEEQAEARQAVVKRKKRVVKKQVPQA